MIGEILCSLISPAITFTFCAMLWWFLKKTHQGMAMTLEHHRQVVAEQAETINGRDETIRELLAEIEQLNETIDRIRSREGTVAL